MVLLDLPPGTGDVQITLTQSAPLTGALIVTTPSAIALEDVRRGVEMFRQTEVPLLGLVENMSAFNCDQCGHQTPLFGQGADGRQLNYCRFPFFGLFHSTPRSAKVPTAVNRPCAHSHRPPAARRLPRWGNK